MTSHTSAMLRQWNGGTLRTLREGKGWTQGELAWHSSTDVGTISRLERDKHGPRAETIARLAAALGVDEATFFAVADEAAA